MRFIFASHERFAEVTRIKDVITIFVTVDNQIHLRFRCTRFMMMFSASSRIIPRQLERSDGAIGARRYGRQDMSPFSDIDLLFLRPEDAPEGVYRGIRNMLYMLWDARIELGHSVRTRKSACMKR